MMKLNEVFKYCGLGEIISEPIVIEGGLMHRVYKVTTSDHQYAVKKLNPVIMKRKGVLEHITHSEKIGIKARQIVPAIPAKIFHGQPILVFADDYYIIFDWIEGVSIFPPHISRQHCYKIGTILGQIHSANLWVPSLNKETTEVDMYEWTSYLQMGREANESWTENLAEMIESLEIWNRKLIQASRKVSENVTLSHRDLDPKNVIWSKEEPYLIDWEAAGYVNPYQELLEVLKDWADDGNGQLNKENLDALYSAYTEYDDCSSVDWDAVIASGYGGMLGWLAYSLKRSLGIEAGSEEERTLGREQVVSTIKSLRQYDNQTAWLKSYLIREDM